MFIFNWYNKLILFVVICISLGYIGYFFKSSFSHEYQVFMSDNSSEVSSLIQRQAQAWQEGKVEQIMADFAEDAVFIVPGSIFKGREIASAAAKYFEQYQNTQIKIHRIIYDYPHGAVQWSWQDVERQTGKKTSAEDVIIFALKEQKIVYWREYIEPQNDNQ